MLRAIRLAALSESPFAFASSYESESALSDEQWEARARAGAAGCDRSSFVAVVKDQIVGLIGAFRPEAHEPVIELVSMWTSPTARRAGVASALVRGVLAWARDCSATTVHLWVTRGNVPAQRMYESMGFRETGESQPLPSDASLHELGMTLDL
jgi:GNAT superfamily N-acetyltransferase